MRKIVQKYKHYIPKTKMGKAAVIVISLWVIIALLSPFLANNKPILAKGLDGWSMPIWTQSEQKSTSDYSFAINPIIPYRFDDIDLEYSFEPPFSKGSKGIHLLGTDQLGRDVAAGMINGARVAFIVSTSAILLSAFFGILIGLIVGFYGDKGIQRNLAQQFFLLLATIYFIYYFYHLMIDGLSLSSLLPLIAIGALGYFLNALLGRLPIKKYGLPIDIIVQRTFEINESVPGLFIILAFVAIVINASLMTISLILAFLVWMTFARHARAEALELKQEDYIQSAKASGLSDLQIMVRHILPNALPTIMVVVAFSFSGTILMESTLSFLGIGLPLEEISWGKILTEARKSPKAWWLAVFPGLAIFLVLYSFNTLGDIFANYQRNQR